MPMSKTQVGIYSLGQRTDRGQEVQYLLDAARFRDAAGNLGLTSVCTDGRDKRVQVWVKVDPRYPAVLETVEALAVDCRTRTQKYLSVGFVDHHGRWTAVALAELVADYLKEKGDYDVHTVHHELGGNPSSSQNGYHLYH